MLNILTLAWAQLAIIAVYFVYRRGRQIEKLKAELEAARNKPDASQIILEKWWSADKEHRSVILCDTSKPRINFPIPSLSGGFHRNSLAELLTNLIHIHDTTATHAERQANLEVMRNVNTGTDFEQQRREADARFAFGLQHRPGSPLARRPNDSLPACMCCGKPSSHSKSATTALCCTCFVAKGYAPSDWHPGCMQAKEHLRAATEGKIDAAS